MKNIVVILLVVMGVFTSCSDKKEGCINLICTEEFVSFTIKFEDSNGNAVNVDDYFAINTRTEKIISTAKGDYPSEGYYIVASDINITDFSKSGDIVLVSGKHPESQEIKTAEFKIAGGECTCHISKILGPEKIVFD